MERILIEGLDLTGKTKLCENLVNEHPNEFEYKKSFYSENNDLYFEAVKKSKLGIYSEMAIAWMYIAAAQYELDMQEKLKEIKNNKTIIQDSFFLNRMIGFHGVKDRKLLLMEIRALISQFEKPSQTFYLYTDIFTRQKRYYEREKVKTPAIGDKLVFEDKDVSTKREKILRDLMIEYYDSKIIDTSLIEPKELSEKVYRKIRKK